MIAKRRTFFMDLVQSFTGCLLLVVRDLRL
jgi:hypothetical protein